MKKILKYRPAAAAFLCMMAMALVTTGLSFFVAPVSEALGVGRGSFTLYYSFMTLAGAFSGPVIGRYVGKHGPRKILLASSIWCGIGFTLFSFLNSVYAFYGIGLVMGLLGTGCLTLCSNVIVQRSYSTKEVSGILGVVMAGSGVCGMLVSAILPGVLENLGWRMGYRLLGILWFAMLGLAFFVLGEPVSNQASKKLEQGTVQGVTVQEALKSCKFYMMMVCAVILAAACGSLQHLPSIFASMGFSSDGVGMLMSFMTAVLAVGKIAQGFLYGKVGVRIGGLITISGFILCYILMPYKGFVYLSVILLGIGMGVYTTLLPIVIREVFGSLQYAEIFSIVMLGGSLSSFVASPSWGLAYDTFGNYNVAYTITTGLLLLVLVLYCLLFKKRK